MHKRQSLKILPAGPSVDRVRLLDGKPLQEPPVLLPGEGAYFGSITRPLEAPVVEPLVKDHEPGLVKMEGLDPVRLPPTEALAKGSMS